MSASLVTVTLTITSNPRGPAKRVWQVHLGPELIAETTRRDIAYRLAEALAGEREKVSVGQAWEQVGAGLRTGEGPR